MTKKQFAGLGKQLSDKYPEFITAGKLLYPAPVGDILSGPCFEGSGFSKENFYVWFFAMPLYVPTTHIAFTLGDRLRRRGKDDWSNGLENLSADLIKAFQKDAMPWIERMSSTDQFVEVLSRRAAMDPHHAIARAFGLVLLRKPHEALSAIDELIPRIDTKIAWQRTISEQAMLVKELLLEDEGKATKQLHIWKQETLANLGLAKPNHAGS